MTGNSSWNFCLEKETYVEIDIKIIEVMHICDVCIKYVAI